MSSPAHHGSRGPEVELGHGAATAGLSNLNLGGRDPGNGTEGHDRQDVQGQHRRALPWQGPARFLELEDHRDEWNVYVPQEQVVEIAIRRRQRSRDTGRRCPSVRPACCASARTQKWASDATR